MTRYIAHRSVAPRLPPAPVRSAPTLSESEIAARWRALCVKEGRTPKLPCTQTFAPRGDTMQIIAALCRGPLTRAALEAELQRPAGDALRNLKGKGLLTGERIPGRLESLYTITDAGRALLKGETQ